MTGNHIVSPKLYLLVFGTLMVGTALTVAAARVDLGELNIIVAMTIAVFKATLVVLYFMHLRWSGRLIWIFAAASILWLLLLIGLVVADMATRPWDA